MERIQEAIEKARRERQGNIGKPSIDEESDSLLEAEDKLAEKRSAESEMGLGQSSRKNSIRVDYSETKQVLLDEDFLKRQHIIGGFAHDKHAEPYRQLRSQILKAFRDNGWQTLAVTSPNSSAGCTLTAINLAVSLSLEANQTVLLVDLNLREPAVAETLGLGDLEHSLVDCINGKCEIKDLLINPGFERLVVLPTKPHASHTSEILSSPEMSALREQLIARYPSRVIIFDLPPVLENDDAIVFSPLCDATLMVIEEGGTKKDDLARAYELLDDSNIIGSVLNKVRYS